MARIQNDNGWKIALENSAVFPLDTGAELLYDCAVFACDGRVVRPFFCMDQTSHTLQIIYGGIDDYNMDLPDSDRLEKSLETILFSPGGKLDSVGFVALSTAIEARIQKISGQAFPLFTQEALNRPDQPLKSVGTLAAYLAEKLRP